MIALFKARFGTPTNDYGSGTEEEIMLALEMGKKVMLYCWNPSGDLSVEEKDGLEKIEALKRRLGGKVLYKSYTDASNLRSMLDFDLAMLLGELRAKSAAAGKPQLSLLCGDGARVGGLVSEFESAEEERVLAQRRVDYCIKCIEEVNPEAYSRCRRLRDVQSLQRPSDWAKTGEEIDRILGDVSYEALVSEGSRPRMATYGELKEELDAASRIAKDARLRLVEAMRDEVKADIGI